MSKEKLPPLSINLILLPLFVVVLIWGVYWMDWNNFYELHEYGVLPRTVVGLRGIVFSPFIHGGIKHLYNNSIALFVLLLMLQYFYKKQALVVLILGILLSGFGTWLMGRDSYHIGASGLVYVLVSFMFFKGVQTRYYRLMALSLVIVVLYGGTVWYMFPHVESGISWEGHLSGFLTGLILSFVVSSPEHIEQGDKYEWQDPNFDPQSDPFMRCFDEHGNFIIIPKQKKSKDPYRKTLPVLISQYQIR
ncbi:rhomboid family intramembrane serine protease [Myroides odoratimimus]|uniref:rhomboid family intramembrane serine protease n=1 Tax=Myroides odoratimimus TaxID=76832 RepID=UPI002DBB752E|nr:rhomboid family intramembrane serine protease [Myroides odoratimimus]MEC4051213.1 rhomboid family intramembrane serine protease [Myroides odoratimimus]